MIVEGTKDELLAAGVISEGERLPAGPRGTIEQHKPWRKVTMLADRRLRIAGLRARERAAALDVEFQRFLRSALPQAS
jgi:hypothetical protein